MRRIKVTQHGLFVSFLACLSAALLICGIIVMLGFVPSCATIGIKPPTQSTCDKIAYYDQYVTGAESWLKIVGMIPVVSQYVAEAAAALVVVDAVLQDAVSICNSLASGAATEPQATAALDTVYDKIQSFNAKAGQIQTVLK